MTMEQEKIESLADEYRGKGYVVQVRPRGAELPPFVAEFAPELVATSSSDNVVIEVKSASDFDSARTKELVQALEGRDHWRLEVVFVSPPVAPDVPAQEDLAADEQASRMLTNAELLSRQGQAEAAGLLAWSALETILRKRARSNAPELERQSSARVLKHLYSLGLLEPQLYERLLQLMEFRNAVAHGFQPRTLAPSIPEIVSDIRGLQTAA